MALQPLEDSELTFITNYVDSFKNTSVYRSDLKPIVLMKDEKLSKPEVPSIFITKYKNIIIVVYYRPGQAAFVADAHNNVERAEILKGIRKMLDHPTYPLLLFQEGKREHRISTTTAIILQIMSDCHGYSRALPEDEPFEMVMMTLARSRLNQLTKRIEKVKGTSLYGKIPIDENILQLKCIYCRKRYKNIQAKKMHQRNCKQKD